MVQVNKQMLIIFDSNVTFSTPAVKLRGKKKSVFGFSIARVKKRKQVSCVLSKKEKKRATK